MAVANDLDLRLTAGAAVAREAGTLARDYFQQLDTLEISLKGPQDYLTEADVAVERHIRARLQTLFPGDALIGEEDGGETSPRAWVVDPIDGTANFARGEAHFAVSIAYVVEWKIQLGFIYEPIPDHLYVAQAGGGAYRNNRPIQVSSTQDLAQTRLELPYSKTLPIQSHCQLLTRVVEAGCEVRLPGSAALGLARVADGRSDAYIAQSHNPWDVLAGLLLVQEAGGVINDFLAHGSLTQRNHVFSATPGIAQDLAELVNFR